MRLRVWAVALVSGHVSQLDRIVIKYAEKSMRVRRWHLPVQQTTDVDHTKNNKSAADRHTTRINDTDHSSVGLTTLHKYCN